MGKENHLLKHLKNPAFRDDRSPLTFPGGENRLSTTYDVEPGDWRDVARIISASFNLSTAWLPDTNVAILDEASPVWDALRLTGLGQTNCSTVLTTVVCHELKKWLEDPRHHEKRAEAIRTALANGTWAQKFNLEDNLPILPAIFGYQRLFGLRRYLARPTPGGLTMLGTDPRNKCETMNAIDNRIGRRALGLAKKGRIDADRNRLININDELHCLMAICYSLLTGRQSVILTAWRAPQNLIHVV